MKAPHGWAVIVAVCTIASTAVSADTLIMRDGRRLQGQLVGVRDGTIEFEAQRGFFGRDRVRIDQADVARIEFDEDSRPSSGFGNSNNSNGSSSGSIGSADSGPPSGLRERDVTVSAREPWTDTGVTVRGGQTIYIQATGRVRWGPSRQDGPQGERNSPRNEARPIPGRPAAALIGRIGDSDDYFFIGDDQAAIRMRGAGRLFLGINDDALQDNSGSFRVTVYY